MPGALLDADLIKRLEQLALASRRITAGRLKGERRSRRRGTSPDFADHRHYAAGDDLRFLDWKIYGRLEKLFLKLFLEEEDLQVHVLLDVSRSMEFGAPSKLDYARRLAAALGYVALARMDSLTVHAFADGRVAGFGPKRGKVNALSFFRFLEDLTVTTPTALERSFRAIAREQRRPGLAVVISDFYDYAGYEGAFRCLFGANLEVFGIHVLSPEELKPSIRGDLCLVDSEFMATADISVSPALLDTYGRTLAAFCGGLKGHLVERGGSYVMTSTDMPFERLVLDVMRRKGLVQ